MKKCASNNITYALICTEKYASHVGNNLIWYCWSKKRI